MLMKTASQSNDTPAGPKKQAPAAGPKGGFGMIFHIAVCSPDSVLRSRVERQCLDYYARRDDACIIEQLDSPEALLARDDAGERYELCRSVHAEANAIISAARSEALGATLYMACVEPDTGTLIPGSTSCSMCRRLIINAGIARVVIRDTRTEYRVVDVADWVREDDSLPRSL